MSKLSVEFWTISVPIIATAIGALIKMVWDSYLEQARSRPIIFISYSKGHKNGLFSQYLTIKNYGQTTGWIKKVEIEPLIENDGDDLMPNTFSDFKKFPLAPNQEFTTLISGGINSKLIAVDNRKFKIVYSPDFRKRKSYVTEYTVNEKGLPTILEDGNFQVELRLEQQNKILEKMVDQQKELIKSLGKSS
ncbi:hypothetical protein [Lactovum miscens]|uniref:Uncharacterized protein n=1 Tax=Lactovum miscens TaxID=190387 RepID=A0A841C8S9_9LACT|nr:hypothetical protein [Lactovum miscens]MBB5887630.1 hypothetical protein [Lactovum miscens]